MSDRESLGSTRYLQGHKVQSIGYIGKADAKRQTRRPENRLSDELYIAPRYAAQSLSHDQGDDMHVFL